MKTFTATLAAAGMVMVYAGGGTQPDLRDRARPPVAEPPHSAAALPAVNDDAVIDEYCVRCHSDRRMTGNMTLESYDAANPTSDPVLTEKMIVKLRAGMMPPPGAKRPGGDTLTALVSDLENRVDKAAAEHPDPGARSFQRLNQAEYARSIKELLDLDIDASRYLPLDTKSANFDNIADAQILSATLLDSYLNAAAEISRLAVGDPRATAGSTTYTNSGYTSQWDRVDGAPYGTRGGISVVHNFPADGNYGFTLAFEHTTTGGFYGGSGFNEQLEISIDGERAALIDVDRWMDVSDPNGATQSVDPVFIRAGPHRVTAAFLKLGEGPIEDLTTPHDWSLSDRQIGVGGYGTTTPAHLKDLVIKGPFDVTGVSETPSRERIFTCRPTSAAEERPCAEQIVDRLAPQAWRRPLKAEDRDQLLGFYDLGRKSGTFEDGVRTMIEALIASPDFVFRLEEAPTDVKPGATYRITDQDLATRLSFFLWALPPDAELMKLADAGKLHDPSVLEAQTKRLLADPRSNALGSRFASQWLRLEDVEKVHPDRLMYPDFHQQLADAMVQETELLFDYLVHEDRSMLELYTADYTFVNERLAKHYGIPGVVGEDFRLVHYPDDHRRGILGHGSILTLTSHAGRTSPVLRGKWIMEVVMGTPPPPPPPNVPSLDESTSENVDGKPLTTRQRMEMHRAAPTCNACHRFIDPIGLALDNYDVTGKWRIKENGVALDTQGQLYDGTKIDSPAALQEALLDRKVLLVRSFTSNLMAYALGRRVEYFDQPTVRKIARDAEANGYKMSSFILGVIESDAFQMQRAGMATQDAARSEH